MLFHTLPFLVFMLVVLPGFYALRGTRLWITWLLCASYLFYGWWNPYYLLLVLYSTALDYLLVTLMDRCPTAGQGRATSGDKLLGVAFGVSIVLGLLLLCNALFGPTTLRPASAGFALLVMLMAVGARAGSRRIWLLISLVNNLALLLFFKYARFLIENLNQLSGLHLPDPSILMPLHFSYVLPVGISFFTFQSMSYTIDFYQGKVERERNFLRFATFVCFFPQLMAGPIERARQMLPQFHRQPEFHLQNLTDGASLVLVGLFKKLALADYLALYVEHVYENPGKYGAGSLALATFAFAWQIFFDFSGYTDMARGVAKMLGFNLVLNFNNPYLATGLGDFWARWHISLSSWFRDYIYIPLGGNRRGAIRTNLNLFLTFLVSGIWHGANWTFAIWGGLHAVGVIVTRQFERSALYRERVPRLLKQLCVFLYVAFAWIFFRAANVSDALLIVERIAHMRTGEADIPMPGLMLALVVSVWLYQCLYESRLRGILRNGYVRVALATVMILYLCLCSAGGGTFIYFQF